MHLFQRMKIWKELRRLEQRAREQPSPSTLVDLGQVYINLDLHEKAEAIGEDGLALFPKSIELRQLVDCARRGLRAGRVAQLRAKLTRSPSPVLFRELAELQMELGDGTGVNATCQEWSLRFPDDAACWLSMGQARLAGFYRDLAAREGIEAVKCLERAVEMDPGDPQSRRLLGEVLYRVGAVRRAESHLAELNRLAPDDAEVASLLAYVAGLEDRGDDIDALIGEAEYHGSLLHPSHTAPPAPRADETTAGVRDGLAQVAELPGVRKATFIRGSKAMVRGAIRSGKDPFLRIVRVVAKGAHRFARRLDIGNATKTVIEGPFGRICICVYGDALAAAECAEDAPIEQVLAELQEVVATALSAAVEER
jgi:predicted regulator of Ras-like GTPase activity (Roadblock/LC7/MglB family)